MAVKGLALKLIGLRGKMERPIEDDVGTLCELNLAPTIVLARSMSKLARRDSTKLRSSFPTFVAPDGLYGDPVSPEPALECTSERLDVLGIQKCSEAPLASACASESTWRGMLSHETRST